MIRKILILMAIASVSMAVHAETPVYVGDLNGDGSVDSSDVSIMLEQVLSGGASYKADLNGDGSVDSSDVSVLLEIVLSGGARKIGESYEVNGIEFTMIDVPAGTFTMGATAEQQGSAPDDDEKPTHEVTLSPYMIGQTEVTQELWEAVMGNNPSDFSGDNLPVEQVSWDDCQTFVAKLNELTGKCFRLPTEAEWEYAARGAQSGGTKYAGSDDIDEVAWYDGNSSGTTHPVAQKQPNALGLYDMSGNVLEWCQDWKDNYSSSAQTNPQGPTSGSIRVYRGGSYWNNTSWCCRVSIRFGRVSSSKNNRIGLRLVLDYGTTFTVNGVRFSMIDVPGGTFTMGGTAEQGSDAQSDELPIHTVTLSPYKIGQTEVTQELWEAVMGSNPSSFSGCNLPVENVRWTDCQEFVAKLNELTGKNFRLPTEAEWEYAARGAQSGGTKYAGSDNLDDVAWYGEPLTTGGPHPVATKKPNALGIYDMSGNVWEWCYDRYGETYYEESQGINPQGPMTGYYWVNRGGSWYSDQGNCRVSRRTQMAQSGYTDKTGLRLALDDGNYFVVNGVRFSMIDVPAGSFTMGGTEEQGTDADSDELPTHTVTLSPYKIGQTEVTQELWQAVMGSNPSSFTGDNRPVEQVSWDDCQEFISKLNELTGKCFRLPTEAEWEYAARGAQTGGTKYAGSDNVDEVAWYRGNSSETTHPVATKQPNALGIYDMSGNVNEWCQDWYGSYDESAQFNPHGPVSGSQRILRGGSWRDIKRYNRVSYRSGASPSSGHRRRGLRLALDDRNYYVNGVFFTMVDVPGGTFEMGATSEQGSDVEDIEKPVRSVTLSDYQIGETEVTQELWEAVMGSNPSHFSGENLPVEQVSWSDCQTFIYKLNQITGETFRLPTEAEWEYAARGGHSGGTAYSGSYSINNVAWYSDNASSTTHPVGTKQPNALGIYDMSGNVGEWCRDWYASYPSSAQTDPKGPSSGSFRIHRGGCYNSARNHCRVAYRDYNYPSTRLYEIGLRLAR